MAALYVFAAAISCIWSRVGDMGAVPSVSLAEEDWAPVAWAGWVHGWHAACLWGTGHCWTHLTKCMKLAREQHKRHFFTFKLHCVARINTSSARRGAAEPVTGVLASPVEMAKSSTPRTPTSNVLDTFISSIVNVYGVS